MILLKNLQEAPVTKEGTNIVINDSAESKVLSLEIDGRSEQKTYNGNQLADFSKHITKTIDTTYTFENDIITSTSVGLKYPSVTIINLRELFANNANKILRFGYESFTSTSGEGALVQLDIAYTDNTFNYVFLMQRDGSLDEYIIPSDISNILSANITIRPNNSATAIPGEITITKPLLYFDDNDEYEPYVGNKASPSPDYPQEIESVGYENLFKNVTVLENTYFSDNKTIASASGVKSFYISCKPSTTYRISKVLSTRFRITTTEEIPAIGVTGIDYVADDTVSTMIIKTSSNANYLCIYYYSSSNDTLTEEEIFNSFLITKGTQQYSYIPSDKYGIDINSTGKNLLYLNNNIGGEKNGITYTWEGTKLILNGTATRNTDIYNFGNWGNTLQNEKRLLKAGTYTISVKDNKHYGRFNAVAYYGTSLVIGLYSSNKTFRTYTLTQDKYYSMFYITVLSGATFNNETIEFQIEEGSVATDWEEYKSSNSLITLDEPLRSLPNGVKDIYENGVITRKIGRIVLDGSETWTQPSTSRENVYHFRTYANEPAKAVGISNLTSNYFPVKGSSVDENSIFGNSSNTQLQIYIDKNKASTVDEFKTWLSENNVEVLYELAEPTTEIATVNGELKTFEPITNINNVFDANMRIKYNIYFEFDKILASGYHIKEDKDRTTQKFVNGNRKQIVSDYTDVQIAIDLAPFDLETTHKYLQQLKSGEYTYYSLNEKKYKKANMIIENKPEMTVDIAVDDDIYTSDFTVTLLKASDV